MTDYKKLVDALRCGEYKPECGSSDCTYWSGLGCMDGQLMEDAAAAIEELQAELEKKRTADCWGCKCEKVESKRGEWEKEETGKGIFKQIIYKCSICGRYLDFDGVNAGRGDANYCPCCGAKMMEVQDETEIQG